ncbi:hypothetical protein [uncultured Lamprocystis sp.]|jgi:hypothetical protein|uniref:hypothetical protein n=1 Tax=uncultured Lamprocystis sp. TaxID=543132 RepID=UPI0025D6602E|nr:hypothetical protein [uncultured Lamprocystis sp.]
MSVFDPDRVAPTNTVRQRFWPADLGQNKAKLLMDRYGTFGGLDGRGYAEALTVSTLDAIPGVDLLVTCVDKARIRHAIGTHAWHLDPDRWRDTLWLDLGNGTRTGQVVLGHLGGWMGDPARLPNLYDLFPELADPDASLSVEDALALYAPNFPQVQGQHWRRPSAGRMGSWSIPSRGPWSRPRPAVRLLPEPKRRIRWLAREEANRLMAELPAHLADMIAFRTFGGTPEKGRRHDGALSH